MKRFENAEVGDLVYCRRLGAGVIRQINVGNTYPILCMFGEFTETYSLDGFMILSDAEPILFYRDATNNYLENRPVKYKEVELPDCCAMCESLDHIDSPTRLPVCRAISRFPWRAVSYNGHCGAFKRRSKYGAKA